MFDLDYSESNDSFSSILLQNKLLITKEIVNGIMSAIDEEVDYKNVGSITMPGFTVVDLVVSREYFKDTLQLNMETLIEYEEFELCAKIKEYLTKL